MNWLLYAISVLSILLRNEVNCLQLTEIEVPPLIVIEDEDVDPVALNCHFKLEEDSSSLVVKWTKDNRAVFQWIRGHEPSVFPDYKDEVTSISSNPDQEHSGLLLINPSIESSGIYKCIVQTDKDTLSMEKKLNIIDIQNYTNTLQHNRIQNETQLECIIENVYPEPTLLIQTVDEEPIPIVSVNLTEINNGKFSASAIAVLKTDEESADEYRCVTTFRGLPFNLTTNAESGCLSIIRPGWIYEYALLTALLALVTYKRCTF